jgi:hypothetical protein
MQYRSELVTWLFFVIESTSLILHHNITKLDHALRAWSIRIRNTSSSRFWLHPTPNTLKKVKTFHYKLYSLERLFGQAMSHPIVSLLTVSNLKFGSRPQVALISLITPAPSLMSPTSVCSAAISDEQSNSMIAGCRTHSAVSITPSRQASASSTDEHRLNSLHAVRSTRPLCDLTTQLRYLPPLYHHKIHQCSPWPILMVVISLYSLPAFFCCPAGTAQSKGVKSSTEIQINFWNRHFHNILWVFSYEIKELLCKCLFSVMRSLVFYASYTDDFHPQSLPSTMQLKRLLVCDQSSL